MRGHGAKPAAVAGARRIPPRALLLLGGLVILGVAGCAPLPADSPVPEIVHARVKAEDSARSKAAFTTGVWPKGEWWRAFGDRDLSRLVSAALSGNPDLAAARDRIAAARASWRNARAQLRPHLDATAGIEGEYFSATGEHSLLNGRSVLFGRLEPLQGTYNADISGRNAHQLAAAVGAVRVAEAERAAARLEVTTALAGTWFDVAGLDGALSAQRRRLVLTERLYAVQRARLAAGLADAAGVFAAQQALAALRRKIAVEKGRRTVLLAAVAALAGKAPGKTAQLHPRPAALDRFPVPSDLPIGLLRHRPDVMAALWAVEAARQYVDAAHAAFYPQLNLALFAGWNSIHLADLLDPANFARGLGVSLSVPIFEGGALRARLEGARARYAQAIDRYNKRVLTAVKQVAADLASWQTDREALSQDRSGVAAAKARARVRAAAFHAGLTNALPSIKAAISATKQAERQARQRAAAARSWIGLIAALGGGYRGSPGVGGTPADLGGAHARVDSE